MFQVTRFTDRMKVNVVNKSCLTRAASSCEESRIINIMTPKDARQTAIASNKTPRTTCSPQSSTKIKAIVALVKVGDGAAFDDGVARWMAGDEVGVGIAEH